MKTIIIILLILFCYFGCTKLPSAPDLKEKIEYFRDSVDELSTNQQELMNGVYEVVNSQELFSGNVIVGRWVNNSFMLYSTNDVIFSENIGGFLKNYPDSISFRGYILVVRSGTGDSCTLNMNYNFTRKIINGTKDSFEISGFVKDKKILMRRKKDLFKPTEGSPDFFIMAHRGGGRNSERLGFSENSTELMKFSEKLGATGIEIDVMSTRDKVPIIFHDDTFSPRTISGAYLLGNVSNFDLSQIRRFGRLIYGEQIPTLQEALTKIIDSTNLQIVWLDMKAPSIMPEVVKIQDSMIKYANTKRKIKILLGMPDKKTLDAYCKQPVTTPILIEFDKNLAKNTGNCYAWGPRWTEEIGTESISGKYIFTWTVDMKEYIELYIKKANINGFLSNYPSLVAAKYWSQ